MHSQHTKGTFIASGRKIWPHELHIAEILTSAGHNIEFIKESNLHTADILLDNVEFEIKSPRSATFNSLEHLIKKPLNNLLTSSSTHLA